MKLIFLFFISLLFSQAYCQADFPLVDSSNNYSYSTVHARLAFPVNGQQRIWLKGSAEHNLYKIKNAETGTLIQSGKLTNPFYTEVVNCNSDSVNVSFCNENKKCIDTGVIYLSPEKEKEFSMLLYGCFEPFKIEEINGNLITGVYSGDKGSSQKVRELFKNLAFEKEYIRKRSDEDEKTGNQKNGKIVSKPALLIGTGDQVYVDGSYGQKVKDNYHPLSSWELKKKPLPIIKDSLAYLRFLNQLYNASYSFKDIEAAHKKVPAVHVIDDHEIRDGWGSQGDEYNKGRLNSDLKLHYNLSKRAYIQHQLVASAYDSDSTEKLVSENKTMEYSFVVNGKKGFVFDLRSARDKEARRVVGEQQWEAFEMWLKQLNQDEEFVLVLSIPLSMRPMKSIEKLVYLLKPSLKDDLRDSWSAQPNRKDRDRLIKLLTYYRLNKGIKPIIASGNIHKASITEIWVDPGQDREKFILAYEVISSGISHAGIEKSSQKHSLADITESKKIGKINYPYSYEEKKYAYFPVFRIAVSEQNFAAIDFKQTHTEISTFFYNRFNEKVEQYYLQLNWDISFKESEKQLQKVNKEEYGAEFNFKEEGRWVVQ